MTVRCRIGFVLVLGAAACESSRAPPSATAIDDSTAEYVLDALPEDVQQHTLIDFEGKLAVVGYDVEPVGRVTPGSEVTLRLYWRRLGPIERGWHLFTHVVDAFGLHALAASAGIALYWMRANGTPWVPAFTAEIFAPGWTAGRASVTS